jgi:hypothetical protein
LAVLQTSGQRCSAIGLDSRETTLLPSLTIPGSLSLANDPSLTVPRSPSLANDPSLTSLAHYPWFTGADDSENGALEGFPKPTAVREPSVSTPHRLSRAPRNGIAATT